MYGDSGRQPRHAALESSFLAFLLQLLTLFGYGNLFCLIFLDCDRLMEAHVKNNGDAEGHTTIQELKNSRERLAAGSTVKKQKCEQDTDESKGNTARVVAEKAGQEHLAAEANIEAKAQVERLPEETEAQSVAGDESGADLHSISEMDVRVRPLLPIKVQSRWCLYSR